MLEVEHHKAAADAAAAAALARVRIAQENGMRHRELGGGDLLAGGLIRLLTRILS